jgi:integrase/recombinase XerD
MIEPLLISSLVSDFLEERKTRNRSPMTLKLYTLELGYFCEWLDNNGFPNLTLNNLNTIILRSWFSSLGEHRNNGGVHCNYRIIKTFLNWITVEYELDWKNPIKKVYMKTNKVLPLPEIPLSDVQKLLDACESSRNPTRDRAMLKALIDSGARGSEFVSLNRSDVNLKNGGVKILQGKGSKQRMVYLGDKSLKVLNEYLKSRTDDNPSLFVTDEDGRFAFMGLRMLVTRLCKRAGIKPIGVHSFRRACALTMYRKTKDIFFVSKYLGHSRIDVTIRYLNIGTEDLHESFLSASPADLLN